MEETISKELLAEVLKETVIEIIDDKFETIIYKTADGITKDIDYSVLSRIIKKWAHWQYLPFGDTGRLNGSCYIKSADRGLYNDAEIWVTCLMAHYKYPVDICEDTEDTAILKAGQWIFDYRVKK